MNHSAQATEPSAELQQRIDLLEAWVLLWSHSQNAFHIEQLVHMLEENRNAFVDNRRSDYVVLEIGSRAAVDAAADGLRPICHARDTEKNEVRRLYSSDPEA